MTLTPGLRKFVRTAHVTITVGWLGAVVSFLVLAISGLSSQDARVMQSAYPAMDVISRFVIVPLSIAPLLTGPILSLGTPWGLFRHYWIVVKLLITMLSTVIMQLHMQPINYLSHAALNGTLSGDDDVLRLQMVVASGAALFALITSTALAVYKPRGMTSYGWRKQYEEGGKSPTT